MSSPDVARGEQPPRSSLIPAQIASDGDDAAFLAAAYGLVPDPWQELVLSAWLGRRSDSKWSSPRCGLAVPRQNGKNALLEVRELYGMIALGERFLHTAHEVKTARKAFQRLCGFFENERHYPELAELVREIRRTNGQEAIVLYNGGSVEFIARSKSSGRGYSVDVLVMDEAQELSEDALAALLPTISASTNPQTIMTGTPPGPASVGEVFTRTRAAGVEATDKRLCWLEWSCTDSFDLDSQSEWLRANPALGVRLDIETVADERASMDDETFARERLGVWASDVQTTIFDMARWRKLDIGKESKRPAPVALAVTVSQDRQWAHLGLAGLRADGKRHLQIVRSFRGTAGVVEEAARVAKEQGAVVAVAPSSPAGSLLQELADAKVDTVMVSGRELGQATGMLLDGYEQGTVAHAGQLELDMAVEHARLRQTGESKVWEHRGDVDSAPVWAVTLALFALLAAPPKKKRSGVVVGIR